MTTTDKVVMVIGSVAIVGAAIFGAMALSGGDDSTSAQSTSQTSQVASSGTASAASTTSTGASSTYKDGEYTASATYSVPRSGSNSIAVTLTIKDGVITAVTSNNTYGDGESAEYVDAFEQALEGEVVGQSLAGLSSSRIGGASLTTGGFNDAISDIQSQATA